jgi:hypothetical protein
MTFPTQQGNLTLHHDPERNTWGVAENGGWITGIYDTRETAVAASELPDYVLESLAHIWRHDRQNRPATMLDILKAGDLNGWELDREPYRCPASECPGHTNPTADCPRDQFSTSRTAEDWAARRAARAQLGPHPR